MLVTGLTPKAGYDVSVVSNGNADAVSIAAGTGSNSDNAGVLRVMF
jgi:hypothetical protein